ncbi:tetratricopeptide repeat protein [Gemmata sp.]|uniref:CHAT domain-containing tetratricopeptide repeat protein n=1 Tax=Gemmata sp. TaxID=1914242 RepID=UPI003F6EDD1B
MNRLVMFLLCATACVLLCAPANADDPPKKLTPEERKALIAKVAELSKAGFKAHQAGQVAEGTKAFQDALAITRRGYPKADFPDGHTNLAASLNNLGIVLHGQGKPAEAEPLYKEALEMRQRLFKGDHPQVAASLNDLGVLLQVQAKLAEAAPLLRDALAMHKRLFKGDHPQVVSIMNNLAALHNAQGKPAEAEPLYKEALEMQKRLFKGDHPQVAANLNDLGVLFQVQGKLAEAEPLLRDALAMHERLFKGDHPQVAASLQRLGVLLQVQGKVAEAEQLLTDALAMHKRLFKGDHPDVADSMINLGVHHNVQGKWAEAEPFYKDALAMRKRLFKGDHPDVAGDLNNLAKLLNDQGKSAEAEPLLRDALGMCKRLFKGDHPLLAASLCNLGALLSDQEKLAEAELLYKEALDMNKRLFKGDHPEVAASLCNLGALLSDQEKLAEAELLYQDSLAMCKRLHKGDHLLVASTLGNLASLHNSRGKWAEAEKFHQDSLAMCKRLYKSDHPLVATSLVNLASLHNSRGRWAEAEGLLRESLGITRRLVATYACQKSEGETLTLISSRETALSALLSNARGQGSPASTVYPDVWLEKGAIARIFEQRQLRARAAATDPALALQLAELTDARRRRAELLLAPATKDPGTLTKRADDLKVLEAKIRAFDATLSQRLPAAARTEKLNAATVADLQKALPADAAVVDFLRYTFFEYDKDKPGKAGEKRTARYVAFVVTGDTLAWVDLETAAQIDAAVGAWRGAITSGKDIPADVPAKVRELVWAKVRKEIPAGVKTLYICPDEALCRVPWVALPGDKPGTILLEEYAIAAIPHAPFLLDKLWPQDAPRNPSAAVLAVGGVKYDAELTSPVPNAIASRGDPLLKPGAQPGWGFLPGTVAEVSGVTAGAVRKKFPVTRIEGDAATPAAVLAALPKAGHAHFATHGFFSDPTFRSVFQLDEKDFEKSLRGERIGRAANSPLVMTGLVFAGANNPKTPGRGIVTGEALVDLDLSGLELAVLSACETGLGDVAGGQGTFGLQRAFHYAGASNVVASLWKVPDQPTAAVMAEFYRNLWEKNLSPLEALRQAQLTIYRNPGKIGDLAAGFRGKFEVVPGAADEGPVTTGTTTHPLKWAAFSLSGLGR